MGKRKLETRQDFARALANGFGRGSGKNYKPWLGIRDVPSKGRSSLIAGLTVDREYQTFSDLETHTVYGIEHKRNVIDIREQFPILPLDLVVGIAKRYGIRYPNQPGTHEPAILTTDVLATAQTPSGTIYKPYECKYRSELRKKRELDKLEIKRLFWASLGCEQLLVTEENVDVIAAENLAYISAPLRGELAARPVVTDLDRIVDRFPHRTYIVEAMVEQIAELENVDLVVAREMLYGLIWSHCLSIDIGVSIQETNLIEVRGWNKELYRPASEQNHANIA